MKLANVDGRASIVIDGRVLDIATASGGKLTPDPIVMADVSLHPALRELEARADVDSLPALDQQALGAPIPAPSKIVALALNYASHAIESDKALPTEPHVMAKFPNSVTGPFDDVVIPRGRDMIDYEAEVVLVVGKDFRGIDEAHAWDAVAGITVGQDISDRGEQFRPPIKQFSMAKSYDTFAPIGPYIVTSDSVQNRDDLELSCAVNGVEMQHARTSDFIFSVPAMLSWLSRFVTFHRGDLIFTGTPGGVGDTKNPPSYLVPGDLVETTVSGVGSLRNRMVQK